MNARPLVPSYPDALDAWAEQVRANREQAERLREGEPSRDFYAPMASAFRADPHRTDEPALDTLQGMARPGDTWLDIGAGGGRYALPLALRVREVIAVEPSAAMRDVLWEGMREHGISNIRVVEETWPSATPVEADVSLIAHVGYDIEDVGPFLDAMESSTRRTCVALALDRAPSSMAAPLWPVVHGEERALLPGLRELLVLLLARGRLPEVRLGERTRPRYEDSEAPLRFLRQQLFIAEGGEKDAILRRELPRLLRREGDGYTLPGRPLALGIVSWSPAGA